MHKVWRVAACLQYADGEFLDKKRPFKEYNIEAKTSKNAVKKLKSMFSSCIVTVAGKPECNEMSDSEYDNG